MISYIRDSCGPIEMMNKTSSCVKYIDNPQFLVSSLQRMDDAQVVDRELGITPERNKSTRTTAMTVQVDLGCLRAASITWSTET